jgi:hypothetical protein
MASALACLIASGSPRQVHPSNRTPRPSAVISGMGRYCCKTIFGAGTKNSFLAHRSNCEFWFTEPAIRILLLPNFPGRAAIGRTPSDVFLFSKLPEADQQAILRQANKVEFERSSGTFATISAKCCRHDYVGIASAIPQTADDLLHRRSRRSRAKALNRFAIVARLRLVLSDISMEEIVGSGGSALS